MSAIQVKNFPANLHARLRERAARQGRSVSSYVTEVLERDLSRPTTREWLDSLAKDPPTDITSAEIQQALQEGRREREEKILSAVANSH